MKQKSYQDLEVWRKAMDLVEMVYAVVERLPKEEKFALADQLRRAAVSVPSNIAEGQRRYSKQEMIRFAGISLGSVAEIETQAMLCERLYKINVDDLLKECSAISWMLLALIKSQRNLAK